MCLRGVPRESVVVTGYSLRAGSRGPRFFPFSPLTLGGFVPCDVECSVRASGLRLCPVRGSVRRASMIKRTDALSSLTHRATVSFIPAVGGKREGVRQRGASRGEVNRPNLPRELLYSCSLTITIVSFGKLSHRLAADTNAVFLCKKFKKEYDKY